MSQEQKDDSTFGAPSCIFARIVFINMRTKWNRDEVMNNSSDRSKSSGGLIAALLSERQNSASYMERPKQYDTLCL